MPDSLNVINHYFLRRIETKSLVKIQFVWTPIILFSKGILGQQRDRKRYLARVRRQRGDLQRRYLLSVILLPFAALFLPHRPIFFYVLSFLLHSRVRHLPNSPSRSGSTGLPWSTPGCHIDVDHRKPIHGNSESAFFLGHPVDSSRLLPVPFLLRTSQSSWLD